MLCHLEKTWCWLWQAVVRNFRRIFSCRCASNIVELEMGGLKSRHFYRSCTKLGRYKSSHGMKKVTEKQKWGVLPASEPCQIYFAAIKPKIRFPSLSPSSPNA